MTEIADISRNMLSLMQFSYKMFIYRKLGCECYSKVLRRWEKKKKERKERKKLCGIMPIITFSLIFLFVNASLIQLFMFTPTIPFGLRVTISGRPLLTLIEIGVYIIAIIACVKL